MRKALKSKDQIIQDLSQIFRTYGFDGATLSLLTAGTGLERASLYHYFPKGKADMAEAVLLKALVDLQVKVLDPLKSDLPAQQKIFAMFKSVEKFYCGGSEVCFITIFSQGNLGKKVSESMKKAIQQWSKLLENVLIELKVAKPKESAEQALSLIQGSLILSRAMADPKIFRNQLRLLKEQWH